MRVKTSSASRTGWKWLPALLFSYTVRISISEKAAPSRGACRSTFISYSYRSPGMWSMSGRSALGRPRRPVCVS